MENSVNLKKHGMADRMSHHPMGALLGGGLSATLCGVLGFAHGGIVAGVMAVLGAVVGAPLGAILAASNDGEE